MRHVSKILVALVACVIIAAGAFAAANITYEVSWAQFGNSGGSASGGGYRVDNTFAQIGASNNLSGGSFKVCAGFECAAAISTVTPSPTSTPTLTPTATPIPAGENHLVYLPIVMKP